MTTLVCQTLQSSLSQIINLKNDVRYNIGSIAPYVYMHNAPAGTFTLSIIRNSVTLFSQEFDSSDIQESLNTTDAYAHVFYPVVPGEPLHIGRGQYEIRLSASGYLATGSSFLGWVQQHEDLNNILDYVPGSDEQNPLALRIKVARNY